MVLRLYMDVHVPKAISIRLKLKGIDVLTAQEDAAILFSDTELLKRSTELRRVLFTNDTDFLKESASWQSTNRSFAGVIFAHQMGIGIGQCVEDLSLMAQALDESEMINRLFFLPL